MHFIRKKGRSERKASKGRNLDRRFKELGAVRRYAAPVRGWIKAIREALGVAVEQSEVKGTIELSTLRRVAEALRAPVEHSMLLEDQAVPAKDAEKRLDEMVRETNPRLFWD